VSPRSLSFWRRRRPRRDPLALALGDHRRYERQIDRLHQRHLIDGRLHRLTHEGVSLSSVALHRGRVARLLADAVSTGAYELQPAVLHTIRVGGKERVVFSYPVLDLVVHRVVGELLGERVEPTLSPAVSSYRAGVSWWTGVTAFAAWVRAHHDARPDPRDRGVYVLRRDIDAYTDSIPLDAHSPLWSQVTTALGGPDLTSSPAWPLVEEVLRPLVRLSDGALAARVRGVATGQPISVVCFNLYLRDLDHEVAAVPGGFYARYSDDLLFAHPDPDVAREVDALLEARVAALRLRFNARKRRDLYLTGAGRASAAWPDARGTTQTTFLGMRVGLDGTVALGERKVRVLLREAERRARNTARAMREADDERRGHAVAAVVNRLLDPDEPALGGAPAPLLARAVTDRSQLDWIDHALARVVASAVTGDPGAAAFRQAPYRRIRRDWGLVSVRRRRDNGRRRERLGRSPVGRRG
jgi:hypothetical protein